MFIAAWSSHACAALDLGFIHTWGMRVCRYAGISAFPAGFVEMVKKFNPHITELELSRCRGLGGGAAQQQGARCHA